MTTSHRREPIVFKLNWRCFKQKKHISEGSVIFADERDKNIETLLALEMTVDDVYEELMKLEVDNYCSGPSDDRNTGDQQCIWEFGQIVKGREIYIKLKLTTSNMVDISLHLKGSRIKLYRKGGQRHER